MWQKSPLDVYGLILSWKHSYIFFFIFLFFLFSFFKKKKKKKEHQKTDLIVLGLNDTSTLVGHFVSSPREREKKDRRDSRRDERDREERGTGMKVKKQKK